MTSNWGGHPNHSWNEGGRRRGLAGNDDDNNHDGQWEEKVDSKPSRKIGRRQPPPRQRRVICNALFNHDYLQNDGILLFYFIVVYLT
jgi:hypothetical protein